MPPGVETFLGVLAGVLGVTCGGRPNVGTVVDKAGTPLGV